MFFSRRFLEKRYQRTWLGWIWLPLRPTLDISIRVLLFAGLLKVRSGSDVPYFLFFLVGMSAFRFFEHAAYMSTRGIELNRGILRRVYVPRLTVVAAGIAPGVVEYALYGCITVVALAYYRVVDGRFYLNLGVQTLLWPAGLVLIVLMVFSVALWTSPLAPQARDVRFGLRYILGLWSFITPVIYPLSAVPPSYRRLVELNPMTAPVQMVKYGFFGVGDKVLLTSLAATGVWLVIVGFGGFVFFSRAESIALDSL